MRAGDDRPIGITFASLGVLGPAAVPSVARMAADLGYRSFWTAEANGTDAMTPLGAVRAVAPRLDVATGIAPMRLRSPALAAMTAATLQEMAPTGEVWLGVGVSTPPIVERWHGGEYPDHPLGQVREYLTLVRQLLSGEQVTFEGDHYQVRRFQLAVRYTSDRRPRIVLAALNPRMLALAGELADGVLLNYLPASYVAASVEHVRKGGDATVFAYVHAAVTEWERGVRSAQRDLFGYVMADGYGRMLRSAGFEDEVSEVRARAADGDRDGAVAAISDRMVDEIDHIGDAASVARFVRAYLDAGVDHAVLMPLPWGDDRRAVVDATMAAAAEA
jgi:probable F420-dependent oxidoreductase